MAASPFANPLAPASYKSSPGPEEKPLSNADFKKLLMTPRDGPSARTPARYGRGKEAPADGPSSNPIRPVKQQKSKKDDPERKAKKWHQKKEKDGDQPKYRDRAKERRDDANPDYLEAEAAGFHAVPPPELGKGNTHEIQKKIIENSKFLGGDMEHTHLVKGLDFALLSKMRSEISQKSKDDKEKKDIEKEAHLLAEQRTQAAQTKKGSTLALALGITKKEQAAAAAAAAATAPTVPYTTPLGRAVTLRLLEHTNKSRTELFLPGRMAFVFDLDEEFPQELPTTLIRSKDDCPKDINPLTSRIDPVLLEKMSKVMSFVRQGSKQKKKRRVKEEEDVHSLEKEKANGAPTPTIKIEPTTPAPVEEEDELFPDVGEYVLEVPKKKSVSKSEEKGTEAKPKQAYFEKSGKDVEEGELVEPAPAKFSTKAALAQAQAYAQLNKLGVLDTVNAEKKPEPAEPKKKRQVDEREKDPSFISDTYSECYPGSFETASYAFEESDEEEDLSKMDLGTKRNKLKRWDFDDEESWNAYNDQREAMPKAAFQFGVKMADGRKTRRTPKDKDQKLNTDLNKINAILKKRAEDTVAAARKMDGGAASLIADLEPEEGELPDNRRNRRRHLQVDGERYEV